MFRRMKSPSRGRGRCKRMKKSEGGNDKVTEDSNNNMMTLCSDSRQDEQVYCSSGPHPLLISMLVDMIINFVDPDLETLKELRLVCKTWYDASLLLWRHKVAVLTIVPDSAPFTQPISKSLQFSTFLEIQQDPLSFYRFSQKPYLKYKLRDFTIDIQVCDGHSDVHKAKLFWDVIGPLMEYAHFENCNFLETMELPLHQLLIRKIINLKDLALTKVKLTPADTKSRDPWQIKGKLHPTLKSLTVYGELHFKFVELLGFPLKSAVLNLKPFPRPQSVYHELPTLMNAVSNNEKFFTNVCGSLETLEVFLPPFTVHNSVLSLEVLPLSSLKELKLLGLACHNFNFLRFTPFLQKLCIDLDCYGKRKELKRMIIDSLEEDPPSFEYEIRKPDMTRYFAPEMENFTMDYLNHLEIDYEFKEKGWRLLGDWMPRLRILKTVLSEKTIGVVCEIWGDQLTELVCGFGSKVENKMLVSEENRHPKSKDKKNISDLKILERFQFDAFCGKSKLTDPAVYKGLLKMPTLKFVQICVGPKMSEKAEQDLKTAIQDCHVIRNYSPEDDGDHSFYDCCSRRTFLEEASVSFRQIVYNGRTAGHN